MTDSTSESFSLEQKLKQVTSDMQKYASYNAFIPLTDEFITQKDRITSGKLKGKTVAVKDVIAVKDWPLTCCSNILKGYVSCYHATAVEKVIEEGGILVGKTNHDEFAMGSSNEHSAFGPVKNPIDPAKVPGGSSGGSAAAVALGIVDLALGSDTGGSVRQPAAFCGVYGLKPTYGRISRYGLVAFASSFDQIGTFARTPEDSALLLEVIAGHDPKDSTSADEPVPSYSRNLNGSIPQNIGVPWSFFSEGLDKEILERLKEVVSFLKKAGCKIVDVELPHSQYAIATYYILTMAEASSNLARYDGVRYGLRSSNDSLEELYQMTRSKGFGQEVKRRIMLGTYVLSSGYYDAYYKKAQKVRRLIRDDYVKVFKNLDLLLLPTTPTPPFNLGEKLEDPLQMYLSDIFTTPISLAGLPALSFPAGFSSSGLPIGLQLVGTFFSEESILRLSYYIEQNFQN